LVSVLITAYNREEYISEAIESVLASSFQDFEIVITDDQSTDRTVDIVREYEKKDSRIKLFINTLMRMLFLSIVFRLCLACP
jgi:glycosyltransferase involved in cell wall biosynthesis